MMSAQNVGIIEDMGKITYQKMEYVNVSQVTLKCFQDCAGVNFYFIHIES